MSIRQILTRLIARLIILAKLPRPVRERVKFVVFTGTSGKTTSRDCFAFLLQETGMTHYSRTTGFTNELGIVLSIFGFENFSTRSLRAWWKLLRLRPRLDSYILIELGSDIYSDIGWFLRYFTPYAVVKCGMYRGQWQRDSHALTKERTQLTLAVRNPRLVVDIDPNEYVEAWSMGVYSCEIQEMQQCSDTLDIRLETRTLHLQFARGLFRAQIDAVVRSVFLFTELFPETVIRPETFVGYQFSVNRLQFEVCENAGVVFTDTYKNTPLDCEYFLREVLQLRARRKTIVLSELRPRPTNVMEVYRGLSHFLAKFDEVFFVGPADQYQKLRSVYQNTQFIEQSKAYERVELLKKNLSNGELLCLKASAKYPI